MPSPQILAMLAGMGLRAGGSALRGRSRRRQQQETRRATIASREMEHNMNEDRRLTRNRLGLDLLRGVPETTGGGVRTNMGLDPETVDELMRRRSFDFSRTVPRVGGSGWEDFLVGLMEGGSDLIPEMDIPGSPTAAGSPQAASTGSINPATAPGSGSPVPGGIPQTLTLDQLMELLQGLG